VRVGRDLGARAMRKLQLVFNGLLLALMLFGTSSAWADTVQPVVTASPCTGWYSCGWAGGPHARDKYWKGFTSQLDGVGTKFGAFYACPAGYSWDTAGDYCVSDPKCIAPKVLHPVTKACIDPCEAGKVDSAGYIELGTNAQTQPQVGGCGKTGCYVVLTSSSDRYYVVRNGQKVYFAKGTYTQAGGPDNIAFCKAGDASVAADKTAADVNAAPTCGTGKVPGTVNGQTVCVDPGTGTATKPTDSTPPTTSTSTTTRSTQANADGSTSVTETKTDADGTVTTTVTVIRNGNVESSTTTTSKPGGSSGTPGTGSSTPSSGQSGAVDTCAANPNSVMCQNAGGPATSGAGLYTKKDSKLSDRWDSFAVSAQQAPIINSAKAFFTLGGISGACPRWTYHIDYLDTTVDMNYWCMPEVQSAMSLVGPILMVIAAWAAFKFGVL